MLYVFYHNFFFFYHNFSILDMVDKKVYDDSVQRSSSQPSPRAPSTVSCTPEFRQSWLPTRLGPQLQTLPALWNQSLFAQMISSLCSNDFSTAGVSSYVCIARVPSQMGTVVPLCFSILRLSSKIPSTSTQLQSRSGRKRNQWIIAPISSFFCETILRQCLRGAQHVSSRSEPQLMMLVTSPIIYPPASFFAFSPISGFISWELMKQTNKQKLFLLLSEFFYLC